jgi:hypothetical protein
VVPVALAVPNHTHNSVAADGVIEEAVTVVLDAFTEGVPSVPIGDVVFAPMNEMIRDCAPPPAACVTVGAVSDAPANFHAAVMRCPVPLFCSMNFVQPAGYVTTTLSAATVKQTMMSPVVVPVGTPGVMFPEATEDTVPTARTVGCAMP